MEQKALGLTPFSLSHPWGTPCVQGPAQAALCSAKSPSSLHSQAQGEPGNDLIDAKALPAQLGPSWWPWSIQQLLGGHFKVAGSRDGAQCHGHTHIPLVPSWDLPKVALSTAVSPGWGRGSLSWFCHLCSGLQGQSRQENLCESLQIHF